jgi:cation diffusion facilitator family transporter
MSGLPGFHRSPPMPSDGSSVRRVTVIGLIGNIAIAALKFVVGTVGFSQAVVADAVHSLSDTVTDLAVLLGLKYWSAPADDRHPYGHGRIETMVTLALGLVLTAVALGIGYRAISTVRETHPKQPQWIAFVGAAVSIVFKEILYRWTVAVGRRVRSSALLANAWHHRSDALSSIPAALAVVLALINPRWAFVDHIGAMVVCVIILHAAWGIIRPALDELIDSGAPEHVREQIRSLAAGLRGVETVHAIRCRRSGPGLHIDLHVTVDGSMSVREGHEISEAVKRYLLEHGPDIVDVVVHLEPHEGAAGEPTG